MKRIILSIIAALASVWACNAAGAHAGEIFNEDVTISDAVIPQGEYEGAVIRGNLTINCTVVGQQAFKGAIIVGDVTINAKIISPEAFKDAIIGGERTINDDASVDDTAFASIYEGKIIKGDLVIDGYLSVGREKYRGKVIIGNVTIKRNFAFERSLFGTIVVGNLNIERVVADESSFYGIKVTGDLDIKRTIGFKYSFDNITVYGEKRIDEKSQFLNSVCSADYYESDADDITFENRSINSKEYYRHIFYGDLILDNSVAQNSAFYSAIILGDVFFKSSVAYKDAFYLAKVLGDFVADEKSYLEWDAPERESHAGETFEGDVVITDALVATEQYKGATFMGNLTIESNLIGNQAFENAIILGNLTVKSRTVGNSAFKNVVVSGKVTITDDTQTIDNLAFSGAQMTDDLDLNAGTLAYNAFQSATIGKKLTLGSNVKFGYLVAEAYDEEDYSYYTVYLYNTFNSAKILGGIDAKCSQLPSQSFQEATITGELTYDSDLTAVGSNVFYKAKFSDFTIATQSIKASQFTGVTITGTFALAEPLQEIGEKAFYGAKIATVPTLPSTLKSIGDKAFSNCYMGGTLKLPDGVVLDNQAFGYNHLTGLVFAGDVTFTELKKNGNRGVFAFNSFKSVAIPSSWEAIPDRLFEGCGFLNTLEFADDTQLKKIGISAFRSCGFKTIELPMHVTEIGDSAFNLVQATTIILPLDIKKVGWYAFEASGQKVGGLLPTLCRNVFIPEKKDARLDLSYTGICTIDTMYVWASKGNDLAMPTINNDYGYYASWWQVDQWVEREGTQTVISLMDDPWFMYYGTYKTYFDKGVVYVPYGLKKFLQSQVPEAQNEWQESLCLLPDDHWIEMTMLDYPNYSLEIDETGIGDRPIADDAVEIARYDISGRRLNAPQPGINIVGYSDGSVRKEYVK